MMGAQVFLYPLREVVYPGGLSVDLRTQGVDPGVQAANAGVDLRIEAADVGTERSSLGVDLGVETTYVGTQARTKGVDLGIQAADVGTHHGHDSDEPGDHYPEDRPAERCSHAAMLPGCL